MPCSIKTRRFLRNTKSSLKSTTAFCLRICAELLSKFDIRYSTFDIRHFRLPMSNVEYRMSNIECRMSNAECRMPNVECRSVQLMSRDRQPLVELGSPPVHDDS